MYQANKSRSVTVKWEGTFWGHLCIVSITEMIAIESPVLQKMLISVIDRTVFLHQWTSYIMLEMDFFIQGVRKVLATLFYSQVLYFFFFCSVQKRWYSGKKLISIQVYTFMSTK